MGAGEGYMSTAGEHTDGCKGGALSPRAHARGVSASLLQLLSCSLWFVIRIRASNRFNDQTNID